MTGAAQNGSRFARRLVLVIAGGVVLRLVYDVTVLRELHLGVDSTWYFLEAGVLRHHHSYADPSVFAAHRVPTAAWPPAYPVYLAIMRTLFGTAIRTSQLTGLATAAVTIGLAGTLARRLTADDTTALVSAALVAASPLLIAIDGSVMSETLFVPLALGVALTAAIARDSNRLFPWVLAGALTALATLTRADGLVLFVCLVVPAALLMHRHPSRRLTAITVAALTTAAIVVPWVVRNAVQVDAPTIATISSGTAIGGANCAATYTGRSVGGWDFGCIHAERRTELDEAEQSRRSLGDGVHYARTHITRLPVVVAARVARAAGAWSPVNQAGMEQGETRSRRWQILVSVSSLVVLVAGVSGVVLLARHGRRIAVLVGLLAASAAVVVFGYGNTRFRSAAEPALLIGGAVCLTGLARMRAGSAKAQKPPTPQS